jgi:hypothetical protein
MRGTVEIQRTHLPLLAPARELVRKEFHRQWEANFRDRSNTPPLALLLPYTDSSPLSERQKLAGLLGWIP